MKATFLPDEVEEALRAGRQRITCILTTIRASGCVKINDLLIQGCDKKNRGAINILSLWNDDRGFTARLCS